MASLRVRNGNYELVFSHRIEGKLVKKTFALDTRSEARARKLCDEYTVLYKHGQINPWEDWSPKAHTRQATVAERTSLSDRIDAFLETRSHVTPKTLADYELILRRFAASVGKTMPLSRVEEKDVRAFCFVARYSSATKTTYLRTLRVFFSWAVEAGHLTASPATRVKYPKKTEKTSGKLITDDHLRTLFRTYREDRLQRLRAGKKALRNPWFRPLISLYYYQGLRAQEGLNLRWEQVDFKQESMRIVETKTGAERTIAFRREALAILTAWHRLHGRPKSGLVFYRYVWGKPVPERRDHVTKTFKTLARAAGLPERACLHGLRHSCATNLTRLKVSAFEIKNFLGHDSILTTAMYEHLNHTDTQDTFKSLGL